METGDTAKSGTLSGAPPEYGTSTTDFLSQLAPLGLQLLEPHDHRLVTTRGPAQMAHRKEEPYGK